MKLFWINQDPAPDSLCHCGQGLEPQSTATERRRTGSQLIEEESMSFQLLVPTE